jgi:hypothetical protein
MSKSRCFIHKLKSSSSSHKAWDTFPGVGPWHNMEHQFFRLRFNIQTETFTFVIQTHNFLEWWIVFLMYWHEFPSTLIQHLRHSGPSIINDNTKVKRFGCILASEHQIISIWCLPHMIFGNRLFEAPFVLNPPYTCSTKVSLMFFTKPFRFAQSFLTN